MVQQIDFLPASYHQARQRKQRQLWRRCLAFVFLSLMALGTYGQHHRHVKLKLQRDRLQEQAGRLTSQLQNADELRVQIQQLDAKINLEAFLQYRVPPTRILAAVTNALPRYVTLTECRSSLETINRESSSGSRSRQNQPAEVDSTGKPPEEVDLLRLERENQQSGLFVSLEGIAPDDVSIANYLAALGATEMFDNVRIVYIGEHAYRDHGLRSFRARLAVKKPLGRRQNTERNKRLAKRT